MSGVNGNLLVAKKLFTERALNYGSFKQRCESFRLIFFWVTVGVLSLDLFFRPVRSSYWKAFSPLNLPSQILSASRARKSVDDFSQSELDASAEVWKSYENMIGKQRPKAS
ncbi:hypothetical protein IE077_004185 [Cardiosporidium cionae]|uniref:Transmembrane protein n=1 Tax=Cardiosporidium cionae TaxID=476202 RepID=A0ABQ7J6E4_9APIC|nr:hypothetical protein IE077_004185 [Cardiosporidium cionae]|eukprot:KAF8819547.1 hypothetical protein IE077_004185 [Cardiosporidium cionae]